MTQNHTLDVKGTFLDHPLAELLIEIGQAKFSGSLRLSHNEHKTVFYFDKGTLIFGVSNSKSLRLFNVMLQQNKIDKDAVVKNMNFANDLEFSRSLQNSGMSEADIAAAFSAQIDAIAVDALSWPQGEWHFSPLARLRNDVRFETNTQRVLIDYARCVPSEVVMNRFRSVKEAFAVVEEDPIVQYLQPHEVYVLTRFEDKPLTIEQLRVMSSLPEAGLLQALYVLWLGGILQRRGWNSAFSATKVGKILTARMVKVKTAEDLAAVKEPATVEEPTPEPEPVVMKAAEVTIPLEEYLQRVEDAKTHYDTLGLESDADIVEVKQMYFGLAKLFHPDKFHRESPAKQKRIQKAFTELSHAYETLKDSTARDEYDFKMKKEIEARANRIAEGLAEENANDIKGETALKAFEQGLSLLNEEDYEQAAMLLGRAVHYSPENAQFHAYFGQALSYMDGKAHKAEGEFQKAVKLDPKNAKIRMMLVDFFIDMNQTKRALGELNRFLEIAPGNREAEKRLAKLTNT